MSAQVFESSCQDEASRQVLASLDELARRLQHAGRQLHGLARGVAGEPTIFQPQYLLADLQKLARVAFPPSVTVITRYPPDLWPLAGEPLLVFQLLLALCLEARDHLPDGGTLILAARNEEIGASDPSSDGSEIGKRRPTRAPGRTTARSAPPGRYVVLEAVAEPSESFELAASGARFDAKPGGASGGTRDRQRSAAGRQVATASRRRKASEAGRAAAAAGGFTEPVSQGRAGRTARGRRAYLPAALIGEPEA
jgi:hypothetical protein